MSNKKQKVFGLGILIDGRRWFVTIFHGRQYTFSRVYPFNSQQLVTNSFYHNEVHEESFFIGIIL